MKPAIKSAASATRRPRATPRTGHGRIRERLRTELLDRIVRGELKGGDKLNELRLSRELKVSRTPLREAFLHLEREGFVRSDLRRGFTVGELSSREVRETYPLLAQLEIMAVRNSAALLTPLIPKLERINEEFARARSAQCARDLDTLWHDTLISQSKNARLTAIVATLRLAITRYERLYMSDTDLLAMSVAQHAGIIKHLKRGDIDTALKGLAHNYDFGMQALLRKMGEE
jgi:DNA-binding GntR family transcriptional regulator